MGGGVSTVGDLRLELRVPADPLRRSDPAPVTVVLINAGSAPVVVNRRMAPGYVDSVSREVYFDVDGDYGLCKYERDLPGPTDFVPLAAGAQIGAEIDLLGWYRLTTAGTYHVRAHYECDEELADPPAGAFAGVLDSAAVTIVVQ
jgi:hypothetical protein